MIKYNIDFIEYPEFILSSDFSGFSKSSDFLLGDRATDRPMLLSKLKTKSDFNFSIFEYLDSFDINVYPEVMLIPDSTFKSNKFVIFVDYLIPELSLVIEVDDRGHNRPNRALSDKERDYFTESIGLKTIRIRKHNWKEELELLSNHSSNKFKFSFCNDKCKSFDGIKEWLSDKYKYVIEYLNSTDKPEHSTISRLINYNGYHHSYVSDRLVTILNRFNLYDKDKFIKSTSNNIYQEHLQNYYYLTKKNIV